MGTKYKDLFIIGNDVTRDCNLEGKLCVLVKGSAQYDFVHSEKPAAIFDLCKQMEC